ncbi:MAG: AI-2E family transporter [Clostridia bacterium]|nr:AI-2E family transporter [Clostridia bacterium]
MTRRRDKVIFVLCFAGYCLAVLFALRLLFPFFAALATVALLSPLVRRLKAHTRLSLAALRLFLLSSFLLFLFAASGTLILRLAREAEGFFTSVFDTVSSLFTRLVALWERLKETFSLDSFLSAEELSDILSAMLTRMTETLSSRVGTGVAAFFKALPSVFLSLLLYLFSLFYIALDYPRVKRVLACFLPSAFQPLVSRIREELGLIVRHTLKAYGILFLITFSLLGIAFMLMRIDYPFWWALFIALLDALPAIGIGLVLVPWGIGLLLAENTALGIGMLLLYLALTLFRQLLEPRVLGRELGVSPLLSLLTLYLSLKLFGGVGLFLSPLFSVVFSRLFTRLVSSKNERKSSP